MAVKKVSFGIAFKQNRNQTSQAKHMVPGTLCFGPI